MANRYNERDYERNRSDYDYERNRYGREGWRDTSRQYGNYGTSGYGGYGGSSYGSNYGRGEYGRPYDFEGGSDFGLNEYTRPGRYFGTDAGPNYGQTGGRGYSRNFDEDRIAASSMEGYDREAERYDNRDYDRDYYSNYGGYGASAGSYERNYGTSNYGRGGSYRGGDQTGRYGASDYDRENYGRRYDYERNYGRNRYAQGYRPREERGWWDRVSDEVASWFGDEEAARRRRIDEQHAQHRGRGPRNYRRSDERIKEDVNDRLSDHPYLDASDIDVSVSNSEVTLSGTVNSRYDKRLAEDIADSVSGVTHVQNNLRVKQREYGATGSQFETSATDITNRYGAGTTGATGTTTGTAAGAMTGTSSGGTGLGTGQTNETTADTTSSTSAESNQGTTTGGARSRSKSA